MDHYYFRVDYYYFRVVQMNINHFVKFLLSVNIFFFIGYHWNYGSFFISSHKYSLVVFSMYAIIQNGVHRKNDCHPEYLVSRDTLLVLSQTILTAILIRANLQKNTWFYFKTCLYVCFGEWLWGYWVYIWIFTIPNLNSNRSSYLQDVIRQVECFESFGDDQIR